MINHIESLSHTVKFKPYYSEVEEIVIPAFVLFYGARLAYKICHKPFCLALFFNSKIYTKNIQHSLQLFRGRVLALPKSSARQMKFCLLPRQNVAFLYCALHY